MGRPARLDGFIWRAQQLNDVARGARFADRQRMAVVKVGRWIIGGDRLERLQGKSLEGEVSRS